MKLYYKTFTLVIIVCIDYLVGDYVYFLNQHDLRRLDLCGCANLTLPRCPVKEGYGQGGVGRGYRPNSVNHPAPVFNPCLFQQG